MHFTVTPSRNRFMILMICVVWICVANFGYDPTDQVDSGIVMPMVMAQPMMNGWATYFSGRRCTHGITMRSMLAACLVFAPTYLMLSAGFAPDMSIAAAMVCVDAAWGRRRAGAGVAWPPLAVVCGALSVVGAMLLSEPTVVATPGGYRMFDSGAGIEWARGGSVVTGVLLGIGIVLWRDDSDPVLCLAYANTVAWVVSIIVMLLITVSDVGYGDMGDLNSYQTFAIIFYGTVLFVHQMIVVAFVSTRQGWIAAALMSACVVILPLTQRIARNNDRRDNTDVTQLQIAGIVVTCVQVVVIGILYTRDATMERVWFSVSYRCRRCGGGDADVDDDHEHRPVASIVATTVTPPPLSTTAPSSSVDSPAAVDDFMTPSV